MGLTCTPILFSLVSLATRGAEVDSSANTLTQTTVLLSSSMSAGAGAGAGADEVCGIEVGDMEIAKLGVEV